MYKFVMLNNKRDTNIFFSFIYLFFFLVELGWSTLRLKQKKPATCGLFK